ncbi:MAG: hypothetical protein H8E44_36010 [Planctomycetes bacterium]|nr:hypothetical protein [Planctomycetota bacterium]MBL7038440.1 hypothetical protein [Pirellulaceae bacterium]
MALGTRISQLVLVTVFLAIIFGVPVYQIVVEIWRQQPVQVTDLFRYAPTVKNLRAFEQTLKDNWWGQETVRPWMQRTLFLTLGDTGAKALEGRDGWMFYRPGVQYLTEADRMEAGHSDSAGTRRTSGDTRTRSVVLAIVEFRDQLESQHIELLVVPVPGKASVYPDKLTERFDDCSGAFRSPTERLLDELRECNIETVNLFDAFRQARSAKPTWSSGGTYYLSQDTHWTPAGALIAAKAVALKLRELGYAPETPWQYETQRVQVARRGDVLEMMQVPGLREYFSPEELNCEQIHDPIAGLLIPPVGARDGRFKNDHLLDTPLESSILLLGDSFSRIYQFGEPASLGAVVGGAQQTSAGSGKKRLLPGSAGFPSLLARELAAPVDYIVSDGGAATDVRRRLSVDPEMLDNKTFVIWEFAERDIRLGAHGWLDVPLPPEL